MLVRSPNFPHKDGKTLISLWCGTCPSQSQDENDEESRDAGKIPDLPHELIA